MPVEKVDTHWYLLRKEGEKKTNVLFTECPQGKFLLVTRGGRLVRVVHCIRGWIVDENFRFRPLENGEGPIKEPLDWALGWHFVGGLPFFKFQQIRAHLFRWDKYDPGAEGSATIISHEPEYIIEEFHEYQYGMKFQDLEVGGTKTEEKSGSDNKKGALVQISFEITIRTRIIDPEVALMVNNNWLRDVLQPKIQKMIVHFAGSKGYDEIVAGGKDPDKVSGLSDDFRIYIMENKTFTSEVMRQVGVEIIDIGIVAITPDEEYNKAIRDVAKAEQKREATIVDAQAYADGELIRAEADKRATITRAEGDAQRIRQTIVEPVGGAGHDVAQVLTAENLTGKDSKLNTLVWGSKEGTTTTVPIGNQKTP